MDITENPVICIPCYKDLCTAVDFKLKCLRTEDTIKSRLSGNAGPVNLLDVVNVKENEQETEVEKKEEVIVIHVDNTAEVGNDSHQKVVDILREIKDEDCGAQSTMINQVSVTM